MGKLSEFFFRNVKMSVFENVIATFNESLIKNSFEKKLNQICTIIGKNLVIHKDTKGKLSVQGPLSSLTILETKFKCSFLSIKKDIWDGSTNYWTFKYQRRSKNC